ncbi:unnamed protein product [Orchesella dallaii]|uniref:Uncharacterized protein n=1 Tax=Orchesella dallaii TaxID=48710 RepID=A0ABP1QA30_9HEXA
MLLVVGAEISVFCNPSFYNNQKQRLLARVKTDSSIRIPHPFINIGASHRKFIGPSGQHYYYDMRHDSSLFFADFHCNMLCYFLTWYSYKSSPRKTFLDTMKNTKRLIKSFLYDMK